MADHIYEEQQLEAIKGWWRQNGTKTLVLVAVVAVSIFGYRSWMAHQAETAQTASAYYQKLMSEWDKGDMAPVQSQGQSLKEHYSSTPYASLAALLLAKAAVDEQNYDKAVAELQWVIDNTHFEDLGYLARTRLARVYLAQNKFEQALEVLTPMESEAALDPLYHEVKGDVYMAMGDRENAKQAYQLAYTRIAINQGNHALLKMKLDDANSGAAPSEAE